MASILPFISLNSFDPEMTRAMSAALDSAWQQLEAAGHVDTMPYRAEVTRERMASAILALARKGVSDPQRLTGAAMSVIFAERRMRAAQKANQPNAPATT